MRFDEQKKCNFIEVLWINTFEASQYLKAKGLSERPVCFVTNTSYYQEIKVLSAGKVDKNEKLLVLV
ncbi:hypothetical protein J7E81_10115 [Bacillus sp. ISL-18]|uniref:hypothetical protein n=1 Tax=Bacillus sp. ISL-18 TaxID=2819118 RepID=UPI001BEA4905|nr:hypothetical protein [Bacillus sp. ISL-18]MBT2655583.1 hypothetical protein [Bacillus sp. ISL-18]